MLLAIRINKDGASHVGRLAEELQFDRKQGVMNITTGFGIRKIHVLGFNINMLGRSPIVLVADGDLVAVKDNHGLSSHPLLISATMPQMQMTICDLDHQPVEVDEALLTLYIESI
jgi:hypothetical protein